MFSSSETFIWGSMYNFCFLPLSARKNCATLKWVALFLSLHHASKIKGTSGSPQSSHLQGAWRGSVLPSVFFLGRISCVCTSQFSLVQLCAWGAWMLGDPPRPASHLPRPCSKLTDKQCVLEEDSSRAGESLFRLSPCTDVWAFIQPGHFYRAAFVCCKPFPPSNRAFRGLEMWLNSSSI